MTKRLLLILFFVLNLSGFAQAISTTSWQYEPSIPAICERLTALERLVDQRFKNQDDAIKIAADSLSKRLDAMNEFRQSLTDQSNKFVTKAEYDQAHQRLVEDVKILMDARADWQGQARSQTTMLLLAVAASGIIFGSIGLILRFLKI